MSDEKQIEEMAQIIRNRLPHIGRTCVAGECINGDKNSVHENPCWCVYKEIAEMIYNAGYHKQIEGEWLTKGGFFMEHICSVCGYSVDYLYQRTPFCPECGAKMKGRTEQ